MCGKWCLLETLAPVACRDTSTLSSRTRRHISDHNLSHSQVTFAPATSWDDNEPLTHCIVHIELVDIAHGELNGRLTWRNPALEMV